MSIETNAQDPLELKVLELTAALEASQNQVKTLEAARSTYLKSAHNFTDNLESILCDDYQNGELEVQNLKTQLKASLKINRQNERIIKKLRESSQKNEGILDKISSDLKFAVEEGDKEEEEMNRMMKQLKESMNFNQKEEWTRSPLVKFLQKSARVQKEQDRAEKEVAQGKIDALSLELSQAKATIKELRAQFQMESPAKNHNSLVKFLRRSSICQKEQDSFALETAQEKIEELKRKVEDLEAFGSSFHDSFSLEEIPEDKNLKTMVKFIRRSSICQKEQENFELEVAQDKILELQKKVEDLELSGRKVSEVPLDPSQEIVLDENSCPFDTSLPLPDKIQTLKSLLGSFERETDCQDDKAEIVSALNKTEDFEVSIDYL